MMLASFNFVLIAPEILLLVLGSVILLIDAVSQHPNRQLSYGLTLATLLGLIMVSAWQWYRGMSGQAFSGLYVTDELAHLLKLASYLSLGVTLIYGRRYAQARGMLQHGGELYVLALFALLGQMVMISAGSLITVYLGLELMSLSLYALIALRRDDVRAIEAAMKYFVLGALASGFLLYGMSMVYGATGYLNLGQITQAIQAGNGHANVHSMALVLGVVFIVAGLAFKLGVVPFHMWVPDVYHGAPTIITLVLGAAPKLAAFAITWRVLIHGMHALAADWQPMLLILAVLSLAVGNLTAIAQSNFKRMLAYSTISHMGFVLLGLASGVVPGQTGVGDAYGSALFYMLTYVLTTLGSFGMVLLLAKEGVECDNIDDLKGLNRRRPGYAFLLLLLMLSLAGLPPTLGFYAKLAVLQPLMQAGHFLIAVVAVLFSLVGAFYYLRVVKVMYFDDSVDDDTETIPASSYVQRMLISLNGGLLLVLGVLPNGLMALCVRAIQQSL